MVYYYTGILLKSNQVKDQLGKNTLSFASYTYYKKEKGGIFLWDTPEMQVITITVEAMKRVVVKVIVLLSF